MHFPYYRLPGQQTYIRHIFNDIALGFPDIVGLTSGESIGNADNFAYFLVAGNFNLKKGDSLGPSYGKEANTFLVTGGYSARDLTDDFATNQILSLFGTSRNRRPWMG